MTPDHPSINNHWVPAQLRAGRSRRCGFAAAGAQCSDVMTTKESTRVAEARRIAILSGLRPLDRARIPAEMVAGVTLAALAIPEVMGYTKIAGTPVVTGLYTLLLPVLAYALLGSSRHLVVAADSATAAIMAASLAGLAAVASPQYVALAGMLAILAGGLLLLARLARLGFLADFLSRSVLIGFLTGVGIQVACEQVAGMLGVPKPSGGPITQLIKAVADIGNASGATVAVAAVVLLLLVGGERLWPKLPWALIAVAGAIVASKGFDLATHGVTTVGTVPSGLPRLSLPDVPRGDMLTLVETALAIVVVILAQSAATARAYAAKFQDPFDENADLIGLSAACLSAGLSGTFVVNGSPTKTAMVDSAGGRTQLAQLTTAACVILVLLFLTKPLSYLPNAVLASVVFVIGLRLIDLVGMRRILRRRPVEFIVALATAAVVVVVGVEEGIIVAMALSVIVHTRHSYHPHSRLLVRDPESGGLRSASLAGAQELEPGLAVYLFGASLYYANADRFQQEVLDLAERAEPPLRWLCVAGDAIGDIDYSASETLRAVHAKLAERGITLALSGLVPEVRAELDRDGLIKLLGEAHIFEALDELIRAYELTRRAHPPSGSPPY
jgi:high affinity sulfate transporter 1